MHRLAAALTIALLVVLPGCTSMANVRVTIANHTDREVAFNVTITGSGGAVALHQTGTLQPKESKTLAELRLSSDRFSVLVDASGIQTQQSLDIGSQTLGISIELERDGSIRIAKGST
jgi:hypothetical protein